MSYLGEFAETELANSILGQLQNPAGFREKTCISSTAYMAVAYFLVAAELLAKMFRL